MVAFVKNCFALVSAQQLFWESEYIYNLRFEYEQRRWLAEEMRRDYRIALCREVFAPSAGQD